MRTHQFRYKIFALLIAIFLLIVLIVGAVSSTNSYNTYIDEMKYQFFCEKIQAGMSREDVKKIIDEYDGNSWRDDDITGMSYVYFNESAPRIALGNPVVLGFNSDNTLQGIGSRHKLADEVAINCNK